VGDLDKLYVYFDNYYLYFAITTNNTLDQEGDYQFLLDIVPGGYNDTVVSYGGLTPVVRDAFCKAITVNSTKYGVDYEIYFHWNTHSATPPDISSATIAVWLNKTPSSLSQYSEYWNYTDITQYKGTYYDYEITTLGALKTLWVVIPWSMLNISRPPMFYILAVLVGPDAGNGAVDSIPTDPNVMYLVTPIDTQVFNIMLLIPEPFAVGVTVAVITGISTAFIVKRMEKSL